MGYVMNWKSLNPNWEHGENTPVYNREETPRVPLELKETPLIDRLIKSIERKVCYICAAKETVHLLPISKLPVCISCTERVLND